MAEKDASQVHTGSFWSEDMLLPPLERSLKVPLKVNKTVRDKVDL